MGKSSKGVGKRRVVTAAAAAAAPPVPPAPPAPAPPAAPADGAAVDALLARAEAAVDELDWDTAAGLLEEAVAAAPAEQRALDMLGEVAFQLGDAARAVQCFSDSIQRHPGGANFTRYMYVGQLLEGAASVASYEAGVACLQGLISQQQQQQPPQPDAADRLRLLRRELSKAFCALAELFMTDLCDDDGAEARCEHFAEAAVAADGSCAEALRVLADLRLCQKRPAECVALVTRSVALLEACYPPEDDDEGEGEEGAGAGAAAADVDMEAAAASSSSSSSSSEAAADHEAAVPALLRSDPLAALPSYDSRLRAAQLALEVEAYEPAVTVLGRLLCEDDSDMHVWFLLGEALHMLGEHEAAAERLATAEGMLSAAIARVAAAARSAGKAAKHGSKRAPATGGGAAGVNEGLLHLSRSELEEQRARIRELLAVVRAAAAAQ